MRKSFLFFVLAAVFCIACNSRPDYVIDEETMTELLVDVHMSEGLLDVQGRQMTEHKNYGQEVMAAVLLDHGVTRADYDTSLVWYSQHLKKLIRIYNQVDEELERRAESWRYLAENQGSVISSISGNEVDIWALKTSYVMDESRLSHSLRWTASADTCFYPGDTLRWKFHTYKQKGNQSIIASLALLAENKTFSKNEFLAGASVGPISDDSLVVLTVVPESNSAIRGIVLTLNLLKDEESSSLTPALVDSLQLIRIHRNK
ncbi:MAG: DUF4296 domain-containing protein [Bacteroidales bacterium]|nr:DUF4296 domain-containing protein [Bacteroidales bacterium]